MGTQEFYKAYNTVENKHDIGVREMLVLLKAYAQYKADEGLGKSVEKRGWMNVEYDIAPIFNRFGNGHVFIPSSYGGAENFWEPYSGGVCWRLSKDGLMYVEENEKLYEAFTNVAKAVFEVQ